ncbi:peptidase C10 domain protein [Segatella baroniae F0067]|uniref:Peptidase C10 domain protein n=2 Tax=Segatella baroniae TaxID=305719 RepID=U2P4U0_9BACT|nr:peptidase C10 domain protein [Segatella baroniae F0067]
MEDGQNATAGCEPIALTQIMYYHKWPKQTKAEIPAYTTETKKYNIAAVPAGVVYEWSKMKDEYSVQGTLNTMKACGTLLANVGQAMKADYMTTEGVPPAPTSSIW